MTEHMPDLIGHIKESSIEAIVERQTDLLDKAYIARGTMTTLEYERATQALDAWADRQYARCSKGT